MALPLRGLCLFYRHWQTAWPCVCAHSVWRGCATITSKTRANNAILSIHFKPGRAVKIINFASAEGAWRMHH